MLNERIRYQYTLSALWKKGDGEYVSDTLDITTGYILHTVGEDKPIFDHELAENDYLKSDDGLKMIKAGRRFVMSVSLVLSNDTQVFVSND